MLDGKRKGQLCHYQQNLQTMIFLLVLLILSSVTKVVVQAEEHAACNQNIFDCKTRNAADSQLTDSNITDPNPTTFGNETTPVKSSTSTIGNVPSTNTIDLAPTDTHEVNNGSNEKTTNTKSDVNNDNPSNSTIVSTTLFTTNQISSSSDATHISSTQIATVIIEHLFYVATDETTSPTTVLQELCEPYREFIRTLVATQQPERSLLRKQQQQRRLASPKVMLLEESIGLNYILTLNKDHTTMSCYQLQGHYHLELSHDIEEKYLNQVQSNYEEATLLGIEDGYLAAPPSSRLIIFAPIRVTSVPPKLAAERGSQREGKQQPLSTAVNVTPPAIANLQASNPSEEKDEKKGFDALLMSIILFVLASVPVFWLVVSNNKKLATLKML